MKIKKKAAIAAAVFAAAMNFSACDNYASGAYGPPEEREYEIVVNDGTTKSDTETDPENSEEEKGDEQQ